MATQDTCAKLQECYSDYAENLLPIPQKIAMDRHLAGCEACRSDFALFSRVFALLDSVEPETAEVPSGFRASVLATIAAQPVPRRSSWWTPLTRVPRMMWLGGIAFAAAATTIVTVLSHQLSPDSNSIGVVAASVVGTGFNGTIGSMIQDVAYRQGAGGRNYEVFTLRSPSGISTDANVQAYVLQDDKALLDNNAYGNSDGATPAWSGALEPNTVLTIPVSVASNMPSGGTLNFAIRWSAPGSQFSEQEEAAFVPIPASVSVHSANVASGDTFYKAVEEIAGVYQTTVIADPSALRAIGKTRASAVSGTEPDALQALQDALSASGFVESQQPNGSVLITHP